MPVFLSKLVKKVPPFKNIYVVLEALKTENRELNLRIEELYKKNTELDKKNTELKEDNKRLETKTKELEKNFSKSNDTLKKDIHSNRSLMDHRWELSNKNLDNERKKSWDRYKEISVKLNQTKNELNKDIIYYYYKGLHPSQYEENLKEWFYNQTGGYLNLENPKTYNEKIQWMKLYDSTQQKADLADKYKVRDYVKEKIGEKYLIPLLGVWDKASDISFDELPDSFVLKTNHGCGYNIIVKDKSELNIDDVIKKLNNWMQQDFSYKNGLELHYKLIERKIIAEEYIENLDGDVNDYKVFCFDGKAKYIMLIEDRQTELKRAFYDLNWNLMPFVYDYEITEKAALKPDNLEELISIAEKLSEGFPHVRVDFYQLNSGEWKFGEMTFTTMSGICKWNPPEYNRILGDMIKLPEKKEN